jgi:predicted GIY-YIG superfamily endonuclease
MHYVYLVESLSVQHRRHLGLTTDLKKRLREHNSGESLHTMVSFRPPLTEYA